MSTEGEGTVLKGQTVPDQDPSPEEREGIETFAEIIVNTLINNPHLMESELEPEVYKVKIVRKS